MYESISSGATDVRPTTSTSRPVGSYIVPHSKLKHTALRPVVINVTRKLFSSSTSTLPSPSASQLMPNGTNFTQPVTRPVPTSVMRASCITSA